MRRYWSLSLRVEVSKAKLVLNSYCLRMGYVGVAGVVDGLGGEVFVREVYGQFSVFLREAGIPSEGFSQ